MYLVRVSVGQKNLIISFLLILSVLAAPVPIWAGLVIQSQTAIEIELIGYNSLSESFIFKDDLAAGSKREIDSLYRGLALLVFSGGQSYPVIVGDESFTLKITNSAEPPSFAGSAENDSFYKSLLSNDPVPSQYHFTLLMIQAKQLLESSHSIRTMQELTAKKKEFHDFVGKYYQSLKNSDMIKRLVAQYFMFHEYVDYHTKGAPAADIRVQYQKEVLNGVGSWLAILKPHIPEQEVLNCCVSLYYNRSMVSLAALIIENFRDHAHCLGEAKEAFSFPDDLRVIEADDNKERKLVDFIGKKIIAFVSEDCPVSLVETVVKARKQARQKENVPVIVAPLEPLSDTHLAMAKMIRNGNMFFINDEKWREDNLPKRIKLPFFVLVEDDVD